VRENTDVAQIQDVLRSYAEDGYDMVIGHGFQFAEPVMEIHAEYPDTWFVVNTAQVAAEPNVASFDNRWGDAGYMAGAVAALYSKTGTIGHIGGIPVPVIEDFNTGFERGARHVRPDTKVLSAYVGSFSDVARGAEITTSLIEQGADVVTSTGNENVIGTIQAAQKAGKHAIGTAFDSQAAAPDTIITTALINENGIGLAPFRNFEAAFSPDDMAKINGLVEDIRAGKITDLP
jgi:basic membrane protein A